MNGHVIVNGKRQERALSQKDGIFYREGTSDDRTLGEIVRSYGWLNVKDRTVLDIGAHIGGFTMWALRNGASCVVSVEPDSCNFELLTINTLPFDTHSLLIEGAVVGHNEPFEDIWYTPNGKNHGMISTTPTRKRTKATVSALKFSDLLAHYDPEILKVDCEGAEYQFLDGRCLRNIREVAVELHFGHKIWRSIEGPAVAQSFQNWDVVRPPVIGAKNWTTVAGWRR